MFRIINVSLLVCLFSIIVLVGCKTNQEIKNNNNNNRNNNLPLLKERPSWLRTCKKSDPKLNECLRDLFDNMFPQLAKGIPEIGVIPYEPLRLKRVSVSKGAGAVTLSGSLYNMMIRGPSKAIPTFSDLRLKDNIFNFGIDLPLLDIDSHYNLVGKILVLPLVGNGPCKLNLKDVRTIITTNYTIVQKENREVMHVDEMRVNFKVGYMHIKLDNLFNGNKVLGQTVNNFLNMHGLEVIGELSDSLGDSLSGVFLTLMNQIFNRLPLDLWLLDE